MMVTIGERGSSFSSGSCSGCAKSAAYSSSRTAWNPNSDAISSIWSKSRRWFTVTIIPISLNANCTIWVAGTFISSASSETEMNSLTRTRVFSRSRSSADLLAIRSR